MARFTRRKPGGRKQSPKDKKDLYWRVDKGKRNGSLELLLLGLISASIGVMFFLVFFGG